MVLLSEYKILERIKLNNDKVFYRAETRNKNQKVILKVFRNSDFDSGELGLMANEFEIANNSSFKGIAKYLKLESYKNYTICVMDDIAGKSLKEHLQNYEVNIYTSLKIAIGITAILEHFYEKGIVHQDLCPSCFLINPQEHVVNLIDLPIATHTSILIRRLVKSGFSNESLAYISPEQTGRIKGEIDIRSNLYSLGTILYELFTGKVPFESKDPLALIHCHIAKSPVPPEQFNAHLPDTISEIILKLLAKDPNDRYQSPFGLKADLENCLNQWSTKGYIKVFKVAQDDFSGRVQNPNHFFGREKEIETLSNAYSRVKAGTVEIVLVEGNAGIGKSALVFQIRNLITLQGGIFVNAKFNQFQTNTPYYAFIQAFKQFTNLILTKSIVEIGIWKERILKAVGVNGRVLTEVIPHLELLLGPQPQVPVLEPIETKNRFHYTFVNFITCISQKDHPFVIFFDDLQWSDNSSSSLLKTIALDKDLHFLLFIGAYRDNELTSNSVFYSVLQDMRKDKRNIEKITLLSLSRKNTEDLVFEALGHRLLDGQSLVSLIYNKSRGNPFFINAFLKFLQSENNLSFNFQTFKWTWDIEKINQLRFINDIVELMTGSVQKLPKATINLLKTAACLGYDFDVKLLRTAMHQTQQEITDNLKPALKEDLVLSTGENYCFAHDRIQQAVYSLIPDAEKTLEHLKIGKLLLVNLSSEERNTYIFEIVNQLNAGIYSIVVKEENEHLATLNLTAGIKAKNSAAYKPSFDYLKTGIDLIGNGDWKTNYDLALQLHSEGAESAFLNGNIEIMDKWIDHVLKNAVTVLDKVKVYEVRIKYFIAQNEQLKAVQTSLTILELLDVRFPGTPTKIDVYYALFQTWLALKRRPAETLIDLPSTNDPKVEASIRLLSSVGSAVYFALPNFFPLMVCKGFLLMIRNGNTPYSGIVCTSYGMIILGGVGNINAGYRLGKIAMQLSEKFDAIALKCQSRMMINTFCVHWKEHLRDTLEPLLNNYWFGLENGNIEFATYSALVHCYNAFFCGYNLTELIEKNNSFLERFQQLHHESALNLHAICSQAVINLCAPVQNTTILSGKVHQEEKMVSFYKKNGGEKALFKIYLYKLILSYLFEKFDEAQQNGLEAGNRISSASGSPEVVNFYFYETLTLLSLLQSQKIPQRNLRRKVSKNLRKFRTFERLSPMNCSHKLLLMEAELFKVLGSFEKAGVYYDNAIAEAQKNEYVNDVALAFELAGKFYLSRQREFIAQHYFSQSHKFYHKWGALSKVKDLESKYPYLFEKELSENLLGNLATSDLPKGSAQSNSSSESDIKQLDLQTIMKATAAISSEVQLDSLLKKLIKIAVENASAQHGYLILVKESNFFIEAAGSINSEQDIDLQSIPIKGNESVSEAIVHFVFFSKENLVLGNAIEHPEFSTDKCIKKNNSKSILCMPIIHQGDAIGLLYLENNFITDAFTHEHIELLTLLSGQMAISLQNALNEQKKMIALTEREKLVEQINLHQQELLKTKLEIQEQTYHNISEELHDNIGQVLSLIKININSIDIASGRNAEEKLAESKNLLNKVMHDIRDLSKTLNTDFIDDIGLVNAIDQQLNLLKKTGLYSPKLTLTGYISKYESQCELVLFRIVQELLNNVVKHAEASTIDVSIDYHPEKLIITVHDNGKGFDLLQPRLSANNGLGLRNIKNRIALIKGTILFHSDPKMGTTVTIELPASDATLGITPA